MILREIIKSVTNFLKNFRKSNGNNGESTNNSAQMKKITVSAWNNGKHDPRGNGYGIRVGKNNRYLFERNWESIELSIEGSDFFQVPITPGFWRNCPEFRSTKIGEWFINKRLAPWELGQTPKLSLTKIDGNKFKLEQEEINPKTESERI